MKKSTRILALIVTVVMIISALSTLAFAADFGGFHVLFFFASEVKARFGA